MPPVPQLALENQLCFSLYRASRVMMRTYQSLLADLDLTYPQYIVMLVLWEEEGTCGMRELGERVDLDSGTLTPLLRRLEGAGLLQRRRDPADERRVIVTLTDAGRELEARAVSVPTELARRLSALDLDPRALQEQLNAIGTSAI